jgi:hypothetical protein
MGFETTKRFQGKTGKAGAHQARDQDHRNNGQPHGDGVK